MDQATLASWHDFYVTMGTAAASLIGLLFVALSINLEAITGGSRDDLRAFAEQAFNSFSVVLLIAVGFLIPTDNAASLGVAFLLLGAIVGVRMLRRAPAVWRGRQRGQLGDALFWRFILPAGAMLGLVAAAVGFLVNQPSALYWLVFVIIGLLMSAARSSWDLLVRVGEDRRAAAAAA
ncbi:MAG TPA: hypothetical protein VID25_01515 [Candidatus Limnocylindrales bacterium]|jgi:drug/metabolite transporter (DMT)-like permease